MGAGWMVATPQRETAVPLARSGVFITPNAVKIPMKTRPGNSRLVRGRGVDFSGG